MMAFLLGVALAFSLYAYFRYRSREDGWAKKSDDIALGSVDVHTTARDPRDAAAGGYAYAPRRQQVVSMPMMAAPPQRPPGPPPVAAGAPGWSAPVAMSPTGAATPPAFPVPAPAQPPAQQQQGASLTSAFLPPPSVHNDPPLGAKPAPAAPPAGPPQAHPPPPNPFQQPAAAHAQPPQPQPQHAPPPQPLPAQAPPPYPAQAPVYAPPQQPAPQHPVQQPVQYPPQQQQPHQQPPPQHPPQQHLAQNVRAAASPIPPAQPAHPAQPFVQPMPPHVQPAPPQPFVQPPPPPPAPPPPPPPPAAPILPPTFEIEFSEIKLGKQVGSGAFGKVYRATWRGTDVAVKLFQANALSTDVLNEFRKEVGVLASLRHPQIILFMAACTKPPDLAIVTEFCSRGSLWDIIHSQTPLDFKMIVKISTEIARGMLYLHSSGLIHRDLKSANILIDENWCIKISDFGLTRLRAHMDTVLTGQSGTYQWMAPEVLNNQRYSEKADCFSFGIVMYELITRKLPYEGLDGMQAALGVLHRGLRPDIPPSTSPVLAKLMRSCWAQDPRERPAFDQILQTLRFL